jgi:hypothetical protein
MGVRAEVWDGDLSTRVDDNFLLPTEKNEHNLREKGLTTEDKEMGTTDCPLILKKRIRISS